MKLKREKANEFTKRAITGKVRLTAEMKTELRLKRD
jgi:hypothetical protein